MDFVVVGFGLGALGVLLGYALRGLGARRRRRLAGRDWSDIVRRSRRGRSWRGGGALLIVCGGLLWFVTIVALLVPASDSVGNLLVGGALAFGLFGGALWGVMFARLQPPLPAVTEQTSRAVAPHRQRRSRARPSEAVAFTTIEPESAPTVIDRPAAPTNGRSTESSTVELRPLALDEPESDTSKRSPLLDQNVSADDQLPAPVNRTA